MSLPNSVAFMHDPGYRALRTPVLVSPGLRMHIVNLYSRVALGTTVISDAAWSSSLRIFNSLFLR